MCDVGYQTAMVSNSSPDDDVVPRWKVVQGHLWPDKVYDVAVRYMRKDPGALDGLPTWVADTLKRRIREGGYVLDDQANIVLVTRESLLPWNAFAVGPDRTFVFTVVKESECEQVVRRFTDATTTNALNCKTLSKRILQGGYLGISRRFVQSVLEKSHVMNVLNATPKKPVVKSFKPNFPFEHWQMDLIDLQNWGFHNSNYKYVLVIIDIFSKFVYLFPLKRKEGLPVSVLLNKLFLSGDIPMILHSDQGGEFINQHVQRVCQTFHVKQIWGESYTPQTQGFVECKNKYIKRLMNYYLQDRDTKRYLDVLEQIAFTINNTQHSVTKVTPMMLHRGRQVPTSAVDVGVDYMSDTGNVAIALPTDHDLVNYMIENEGLYRERVSSMRALLLRNAIKQDEKYRQSQTNAALVPGDKVFVYTYQKQPNGDIQPTILKTSDGVRIPSPLTVTNRRVTTVEARPATAFKKVQLNTDKLFKTAFDVVSVQTTTVTLDVMQMKATVPNWTSVFGRSQVVPVPTPNSERNAASFPEYEYVDLSSQTVDRCPRPQTTANAATANAATATGARANAATATGARANAATATGARANAATAPENARNERIANAALTSAVPVVDVLKLPAMLTRKKFVVRFAFREITRDGQRYTGGVDVRRVVVHAKRNPTQRNDRGVSAPWDVKEVSAATGTGAGPVRKVALSPDMYGKIDTIDGWVFEDEPSVRRELYARQPRRYPQVSTN